MTRSSLARGAMLASLCCALLGSAGCSDDRRAQPSASVSPAKPPDVTDPSGLVEGPVELFGLRFPLRATVRSRTATSAVVDVPFAFQSVDSYLRLRLAWESVEVSAKSTVFHDATVERAGEQASLHVILLRTGQTARVTVVKHTGPSEPSTDVRSEYSRLLDGGGPGSGPPGDTPIPPDLR